jgi:hypothetical protein
MRVESSAENKCQNTVNPTLGCQATVSEAITVGCDWPMLLVAGVFLVSLGCSVSGLHFSGGKVHAQCPSEAFHVI